MGKMIFAFLLGVISVSAMAKDTVCNFKYELHEGDTMLNSVGFSGGVSKDPIFLNNYNKVGFVKSVTTFDNKEPKKENDFVNVGSTLNLTIESVSVENSMVKAKLDFDYSKLDRIKKYPVAGADGVFVESPELSAFQFGESVVLSVGEKYKKVFYEGVGESDLKETAELWVKQDEPVTFTLWVESCNVL